MRSDLQSCRRLRLVFADGQAVEEVNSIAYTAGCSGSTDGPTVGAVVGATVTVTMPNQSHALEDETVTLEASEDGSTWRSVALFRLGTPEIGDYSTTVSGTDAVSYALDKTAYTAPATEPGTALALLREACSQAGVTVSDAVLSLTDQAITGANALAGYSCRALVGMVAGLYGKNAVISGGVLAFRWYVNLDQEVGPDEYYPGGSVRKNDLWTPSGMSVDVGGGISLTAGDSSGSVITMTNPLMTQEMLDAVWASVKTLAFHSGSLSAVGDLSIQPGDLLTVTDMAGNAYSFPAMQVTHTYTGGLTTTVEAYGTATADPNTGYTGPLSGALQRIERTVGDLNGAYTQIVQDVNEIELKAVGEEDVISIINASPEQIRLQSNRLIVESDNFTLTETGTVSANAGNFGAFEIDGDAIRCENGELVMRLNSVGSDSYLTPLQLGYWDETWGYNGSTVAELAFYTGSPNCIGLRIWEDGTAGTGSSLYLDMNGKAELYAGQFLVSPPNPIVGQGQPFQVDTDSNAVSIGGTLEVGGRTYGVNQTLWSGATYPTASQTITFASAISAQPNGAVLVWSDYDTENSAAGNYGWCFSFVPKGFVLAHSGAGSSEFSKPYRGMWKRVFLSDTSLTGYDENQNAGTNNGIAYNNAKFVLRYVIGV